MSLSDDIIYHRNDRVKHLVNQGINVNYIDQYGYTPLIQAALVNNLAAASILLKQGAQIDAVDIAGQTALHWAIDNNNVDLTKLLLSYGASANAYTTHGQPALFHPILRKNQTLQQLLLKQGADQNFAKDYINAKLIGHRFELQGFVDVVSAEGVFLPIDLEGFFLEFTISIIGDSLEHFANSYVAHRLDLHTHEIKTIIQAMQNASHLREFKHFNANVEDNLDTINELIQQDLLLLPVSYKGHAITFSKHGDFFAKCDRGDNRMNDPIVIHEIGHPNKLNLNFYKHLLYERQTEQSMKKDIYTYLDLKSFVRLPIRHQITGNCSWANMEASIPTMLFMLLKDKTSTKGDIRSIVRDVMKFYIVWKEWDKDRALEECIAGFDQMNPNRRKAKASLLGAIFFQACDYRKKKDVRRAQRMVEILKRPIYHYILRSYIKTFIKSGRGGAAGKRFHMLLSELNLSPNDFDGY